MADLAKELRRSAPADHGLVGGWLMRDAADEIERLRRIGTSLLRWAEKLDEDLPLSCQQFWAQDIEEARATLGSVCEADHD